MATVVVEVVMNISGAPPQMSPRRLQKALRLKGVGAGVCVRVGGCRQAKYVYATLSVTPHKHWKSFNRKTTHYINNKQLKGMAIPNHSKNFPSHPIPYTLCTLTRILTHIDTNTRIDGLGFGNIWAYSTSELTEEQ